MGLAESVGTGFLTRKDGDSRRVEIKLGARLGAAIRGSPRPTEENYLSISVATKRRRRAATSVQRGAGRITSLARPGLVRRVARRQPVRSRCTPALIRARQARKGEDERERPARWVLHPGRSLSPAQISVNVLGQQSAIQRVGDELCAGGEA